MYFSSTFLTWKLEILDNICGSHYASMGSTFLGTIVTPCSLEYVAGMSGNLLATGRFNYEQVTPETCCFHRAYIPVPEKIQINKPITGSDVFQ